MSDEGTESWEDGCMEGRDGSMDCEAGLVCYLHRRVFSTSISCQRCSKMVAQAALCCTGKRALLRMKLRRRKRGGGGGGGKRRCRGG